MSLQDQEMFTPPVHVTNYVLGFLFNNERTQVVLIEKRKPSWQSGYLNGVGGKVEKYDQNGRHLSIVNAMNREFHEEAGVIATLDNWKVFAEMKGKDWNVYCMMQCNSEALNSVRTMTDERIVVMPVADMANYKVLSNLTWLIPMALDENMGQPPFFATVTY